MNFSAVDDRTLLADLSRLAREDRRIDVEIVLHLAEVDRRHLYVEQGYSSLWEFCTRGLGFTAAVTSKRIRAARAVQKQPEAVTMIVDGRLSVCALEALAAHVEEPGILEEAAGKSKRAVEEIVSARNPKPKKKDVIQVVHTKNDMFADVPEATREHRVAFTASEKLMENIRKLQDLMGTANLDDTLLKATEALLEKIAPERRSERRAKRMQKKAARGAEGASRPEPQRRAEGARATHRTPIPAAVRDAVHLRDRGRCTHSGPDGRCNATRYLEIDHITPVALGGSNAIENLRLLCRPHNQHRARKTFGDHCPPPRR